MSIDVGMRSALETAIAAARLAPSVHNTQPWSFRLHDGGIEVLADFSRQLGVLDPTGRQLHLSCGAALDHLVVALRSAGLDSAVTLFPQDDPAVLARVTVTAGVLPTSEELDLGEAIHARHSQREPFADRAVELEVLAKLRTVAESRHAWLALLQNREDQITLAVLLSHADESESEDPEYRAELQHWLRTDPAFDGIPAGALPTTRGSDRHTEVPVRDYTAGEQPEAASVTSDEEPPDERPALLILGTDADTAGEWVEAGEALSRLLLTATTLDLRASMLGQVIDLPGTRQQLRAQLRLIGEPQMVIRLGYGPPAPPTPRRPLTDLIVE
jgi:nitroreductase